MELWLNRPSELALSATDSEKLWSEKLDFALSHEQERKQWAQESSSDFEKYDWDKAAQSYHESLLRIESQ